MFYLINSRSILASVVNRAGQTGNRVALLAIAACVLLQLTYSYAPTMQSIFGSDSLTGLEWATVAAAGLLVFCIAELEKAVIRRTRLAGHLGYA